MPDKYFGKYSGVVKDNRDGENLGRVQVSVPSIFPPDELMQARPALPFGLFFVPEVGAKVWVEFEGGDPGLPLWTGVQYVAGEWAKEAEADPPQNRVVKTAAGHLIVFRDKGGEEGVEIKDAAHGHIIKLNKDGIEVKDGAQGHALTIKSDGITLATATGEKISVTASGIELNNGKGASLQLSGPVVTSGSLARLGDGAMPALRLGDVFIGNMGAPVVVTPTNTKVLI